MHRLGFRARDVDDQPRDQCPEVEAPVESACETGQVRVSVLAELEAVMGAGDRALEIAQNRVDPVELRQLLWFGTTDHDGHVQALGTRHAGKTRQPSLTTRQPGSRWRHAQRPMTSLAKADTLVSFRYSG